MLLDCPNERRFLRLARQRLGHLFPSIPSRSGFNKRLRQLAPQLVEAITLPARLSRRRSATGSGCSTQPLLDATPVPCTVSRETVRRSALATAATATAAPTAAGSGVRLYLLCSPDGLPVGVADAGLEQHLATLGARRLCPDRKDEPARFGSPGGIRHWIESTFDSLKDQLSLERHRGRTLIGLISRIARRPLALTAVLLHNRQLGTPGPQPHRPRPAKESIV